MKDKKVIYIIVGIVCLVLAIPFVLGLLGGAFYYLSGVK